MQQEQKLTRATKCLKYEMFTRSGQSKDITFSVQQQKSCVLGLLRWLNDYDNILELSPIGKNPVVRYNQQTQECNGQASQKTVRLDCEGKNNSFCRFYLQQDQVKGKTNLAEIYLEKDLVNLMQLNETSTEKAISQKWRGRVQNILIEWRVYVQQFVKEEAQTSVAVRIQLLDP